MEERAAYFTRTGQIFDRRPAALLAEFHYLRQHFNAVASALSVMQETTFMEQIARLRKGLEMMESKGQEFLAASAQDRVDRQEDLQRYCEHVELRRTSVERAIANYYKEASKPDTDQAAAA